MDDRITPTHVFTFSMTGAFSYGPFTTMAELKRMIDVIWTNCPNIKLMYIVPMNSDHWHRVEVVKDVHVPSGSGS